MIIQEKTSSRNKPRNLFKEVRYKVDLTQGEFADELGCAQGYISKLENNLCAPSIFFLIKTKKIFHLKWDYIEAFFLDHPRAPKNERLQA